MRNLNWYEWLVNEEPFALSSAGTPGDPSGIAMGAGGSSPQDQGVTDPTALPPPEQNPPPEDVTQDPEFPDMPDDMTDESTDFETWKAEYLQMAIDGETYELKASLEDINSRPGLTAPQKKFIYDNIQIQTIREDGSVENLTKEIKKLVKQEMDLNNPGTILIQHIHAALEKDLFVPGVFIKLSALYGLKGDLHRKFIAALLGAVQVGGGKNMEDLILSEKEYSINVSTRFATEFGNLNLGSWCLEEDDVRFLEEPERKRLEEGSPEEKDVLRRRVVMESIAAKFEKKSFIIHVTGDDGTVYGLGWDISESLKSAYQEGKLVVRTRKSADSKAMIDENGQIVPLFDLFIYYQMDKGEVDESGDQKLTKTRFMEWRDGSLYLTADLETVRNAASGMSGISFKELPFHGNPSDIQRLAQCIPSAHEMLLRRC